MIENRNYTILAVGKKFSGKTTRILEFAYATKKKIIVVNTDTHPAYKDFPVLNLKQFEKFNGQKCQVRIAEEDEADELATMLNKKKSNSIIIFEDAQKYINSNLSKPFQRLVVNHRMRKNDIVFLYHFLAIVPIKIAMNHDFIFLFKVQDNEADLKGRYGNFRTLKERATKINANPNQHHCEIIFDYE